jgi:hypothetical protein
MFIKALHAVLREQFTPLQAAPPVRCRSFDFQQDMLVKELLSIVTALDLGAALSARARCCAGDINF